MAEIQRRRTLTATIGGVRVGSNAPVMVQSMTNTDTADAAATASQVEDLALAGSELVRITVNNEEAAAAVPAISTAHGSSSPSAPAAPAAARAQ